MEEEQLGRPKKEPCPVVGNVLGVMPISRCWGLGTGLDVPVGSVERGFRLGGAVSASECVCLVCKIEKPE